MTYSADFETTTRTDFTQVWAWGCFDINNNSFEYGTNINSFMEFAELDSNTFYFHNLKFDGQFILYWLFTNDFEYVKTKKEAHNKSFTTIIDDMGNFYNITIYFEKQGKKTKKAVIYDSLKILPFSVKEIAGAFNLSIKKGEIDYSRHNEECAITQEEIEYLRNDVEIVARALKTLFDEGMIKMTTASNALNNFTDLMGKSQLEKLFPMPTLEQDKFIRKSYKGGFTFCNPDYQGKDINEGIVLDVNSLYPSVMFYKALPFGEPLYFQGEYQKNKYYTLYVQRFVCQFEIKKGYLPTIQIKNNPRFCSTDYLYNSAGEDIILTLTSVDLKLFYEHYEVYNIEYLDGYMFKETDSLFKGYISKWARIKNESTLNGNKGMRTLAKLMLNSLYGKFALNPECASKSPYFDKIDGIVKYKTNEIELRPPLYIPVGTFITSWARYITITSAQKVKERFIYADTDSLHLVGFEVPEGLAISDINLGEWKLENKFAKARFLRAKRYMEFHIQDTKKIKIEKHYRKNYNKISNEKHKYYICKCNITCAGMPKSCYDYVSWDNFKNGSRFEGKLIPKIIPGGCVLIPTEFSLNA